jgi:hypothetical protein
VVQAADGVAARAGMLAADGEAVIGIQAVLAAFAVQRADQPGFLLRGKRCRLAHDGGGVGGGK